MADLFKILLAEKLGHCDSLYESVIGKKLGGYSWLSDYETTPYLYRAMPNLSHYYNREIMEEVVGGSVGWNQQYDKSYPTSQTVEGVTFTVNSDGTITLNGAQAGVRDLYYQITPKKSFNNHKLLLTGCPRNGGKYTYRMYMDGHGAESYDTGEGVIFAQTVADKAVYIYIDASYTTTISNLTFKPNITDLTLALGSTIADYVYSLEQATAGSGVAWLKEHFPKMCQYNPYDAGSIQSVSGLVSHDTVGFNQWDEEWEVGSISPANGTNVVSANQIRSKNYIPVIPNTAYYGYCRSLAGTTTGNLVCCYYDADKNFVAYGGALNGVVNNIPSNVHYIRLWTGTAYGATYKNDICINLSDASRNGQYEPYRKSSYPLDSTLTLRGIPKLDNGNLYYDGDVYEADGTVTRKYGIVDLGTLDWTYNGSGSNVYFRTESIDDIKPTALRKGAEIVCSKYVYIGNAQTADISDKQIAQSVNNSSRVLFVKDSAYNDASAFKTAMSGVYLVYELATPTTETAQPFTKTQLCDSGGTEEWTLVGKNLLNPNISAWSSVGTYLHINNVVPEGTTARMTFTDKDTSVSLSGIYVGWVYSDVTDASADYYNWCIESGTKKANTLNESTNRQDTKICRNIFIYPNTQEAFDKLFARYDIMVELGSTPTPYEPYGFNIVSVGHKSKYAEK